MSNIIVITFEFTLSYFDRYARKNYTILTLMFLNALPLLKICRFGSFNLAH